MKVTWNHPEVKEKDDGTWSNMTALVWSSKDVLYLRKELKIVGNLVGPLCRHHSSFLQKGLPMLLNPVQTLVLCALGIMEPPTIELNVDPQLLLRSFVLKDLLSQGYYVSLAAPNFGADFLIYKGTSSYFLLRTFFFFFFFLLFLNGSLCNGQSITIVCGGPLFFSCSFKAILVHLMYFIFSKTEYGLVPRFFTLLVLFF
ncbi:hypothetical protein HMI54_015046 [Coelomomyces lativittatus]|nr:hypothetical protein HMI54_015046 [Coelomomyces lativittatus]